MTNTPPPTSGWVFLGFGIFLGAIGAGLLTALSGSNDDSSNAVLAFVAVLFAGVGSVLATVGAVAVGVTVGFRRADYRIRRS